MILKNLYSKKKIMKRSETFRRTQREKKINKFTKIIKEQKLVGNKNDIELRARKMAITPHPNKCQCCCNIRRSNWYSKEEKLTPGERKVWKDSD